MCQGRRDIVAVADVGDGTPLQRSELLLQRQQIGKRLARMFFVRQRIHDAQGGRRRGELLDDLLGERANHDRIDPAFEITRDVCNRFAVAERDLRRNQYWRTAKLPNRHLERDARSQRGLVEEQRDVPAGEHAGRGTAGGAP